MANETSLNGPAFPVVVPTDAYVETGGMDLRDWFAGQVLAGAIANKERGGGSPSDYALFAYMIADAMLAERAKPATPKEGKSE